MALHKQKRVKSLNLTLILSQFGIFFQPCRCLLELKKASTGTPLKMLFTTSLLCVRLKRDLRRAHASMEAESVVTKVLHIQIYSLLCISKY